MNEGVVWINGEVLPVDAARISPRDHGVIVGDGVFEVTRVISGHPFALSRHLARLERSAGMLGLESPDKNLTRRAVAELLAACGLKSGRLRITFSSGPGALNSVRGGGPGTLTVLAEPYEDHPPEVAVVTLPWARNERGALTGVKSISYAENVRALQRARDSGAGEAIFPNTRGELCEGTGTNVFVAGGDSLLTPPLSSGCLAGVTRGLILEITEAVERTLPLSALGDASEAFLTSATRGVHPVCSVDGVSLAACPGPLTAAAGQAFEDLLSKTFDP